MTSRRATFSVVLVLGAIAAGVIAITPATDWPLILQAASRQGATQPASAASQAPASITSPKAALGFNIGDDYELANYTQISAYWRTIDRESDRVSVVEYGTTSVRDPRGYILPSDQPDFLTATKFVNALIKNGVTVHRASAPFQVAGESYPAESYVVKTAQEFRPHVLDNFEPQDYPDDFAYPGGPPVRPYDVTGYTLAYQMGVQFDRIIEGFDGPFERINGVVRPSPGKVSGAARPLAIS
jgi:hypothetical protein